MTAVDTNILVRLVTNDDPDQAKRAAAVMRAKQVFVAKTVLLELEWVLRYAYGLDQQAVLKAIRGTLGLANVETEDAIDVAQALDWYEKGLDFADALHLVSGKDASEFATFDGKLKKKAARLSAITVVQL